MDYPRSRHVRPGQRRTAIFVAAALVAVLGYAPLKAGAIVALEAGARAGYALTVGAPGLESDSVRQRTDDGAAWLETMSAPQEADTASSHSGGLFFPAYTQDGDVPLPASYREWVFVGGATGLAYGEPARARHDGAPGTFTHVYLEPGAFQHFRETGEFPEGTTFALEMREPTTGVSIARDGWFAGRSSGIHLAVKDTKRLGGWAYFNVDGSGLARQVRSDTCVSCHAEHGAVDNVFVQFYPVLTER